MKKTLFRTSILRSAQFLFLLFLAWELYISTFWEFGGCGKYIWTGGGSGILNGQHVGIVSPWRYVQMSMQYTDFPTITIYVVLICNQP